tara:strand:- start:257 stop:520 length:264 start_codon:yes stop_codon:yes gene_type:complete
MEKILIFIIIKLIKIYQFLLSPFFSARCRYLPSCSEYVLDCFKNLGLIKGFYYSFKRVLRCHPFRFLGGGSGIDMVPTNKSKLRKKI